MKILIIGHELHTHTHSYIFNGIYRALLHMGHDVNWIWDTDDINNISKNNGTGTYDVIITELYYNKNIPIIKNCIYIIQQPFIELFKYVESVINPKGPSFNVTDRTYITDSDMETILQEIPNHNIVLWRPYLNCLAEQVFDTYLEGEYKVIVTPWATDLLPNEIDTNMESIKSIESSTNVTLVGVPVEPWDQVANYCKKNNLTYLHFGGTFNSTSNLNKSIEENAKLIQQSIVAPAVQPKLQLDQGYIPCRIFKNISYGKMGVVNNPVVNQLFNNKLIYSNDINRVMDNAIEFEKSEAKYSTILELMEHVKNHHTYINRINYVFNNIFNNKA